MAPETTLGDERDFGFVFREDGIFRVYVATDADTGEKVKTREEPVEGDEAAALARQAVDPEDLDALEQAIAGGASPGEAAFALRFPNAEANQAEYDEAVAAEMDRRDELAKDGIVL